MRANATLLPLSDDSTRRNGPSYECGADFQAKSCTEVVSYVEKLLLHFPRAQL